MKHLKEVLKKLEAADMHVHQMSEDIPLPVHVCNWDTHFIMQGADIVHVGNLVSIESFALRL